MPILQGFSRPVCRQGQGWGQRAEGSLPHCDKRFLIGLSRGTLALISVPLLLVTNFMFHGAIVHIIGAGLTMAIAAAIALRAEKVPEPVDVAATDDGAPAVAPVAPIEKRRLRKT